MQIQAKLYMKFIYLLCNHDFYLSFSVLVRATEYEPPTTDTTRLNYRFNDPELLIYSWSVPTAKIALPHWGKIAKCVQKLDFKIGRKFEFSRGMMIFWGNFGIFGK